MDVGSITKSRFKGRKKHSNSFILCLMGEGSLHKVKKTQKTVTPKCFYNDIVDISRKM